MTAPESPLRSNAMVMAENGSRSAMMPGASDALDRQAMVGESEAARRTRGCSSKKQCSPVRWCYRRRLLPSTERPTEHTITNFLPIV